MNAGDSTTGHELSEDRLFDFLPWRFASEASQEQRARQVAWQRALRARGVEHVGEGSYVSPLAAVYETSLRIGRDSYIAAHVYLTGDVELGDSSTLNPFAVVRGRVRIGDGVRIGAHASLLGFNHAMEPDEPVYRQPVTSRLADLLLGSAPRQLPAADTFSPTPTVDGEHEPSLQGTEMWLAIIWLLADVLGESGALGYRPRGVHRPEPAP